MAVAAESVTPSTAEISAFEKIDDLFNSFKKTNILVAAIKLGVFTAAHGEHRTAEEIARQCGVHESKKLDPLLDVLVSEELLVRQAGVGAKSAPVYANSEGADLLLGDPKTPTYLQSVGVMMDHFQKEMVQWGGMADVLRSGVKTHTAAHYKDGHHGCEGHHGSEGHHGCEGHHGGEGHHGCEGHHHGPKPEKLPDCHDESAAVEEDEWSGLYDIFEAFMRISFNLLPERFDFSKFRHVVDLGGGTAQLSRILARRVPHLHCINFDLPRVQAAAQKRMELVGRDVMDRVRLVGGNCLTDDIPQPVDLIVAANMMHGFGDDATRKLLIQRAYDALKAGGAFMVVEEIVNSDRGNFPALLMQLSMQIDTECGGEQGSGRSLLTTDQLCEWTGAVGFGADASTVSLVGSMCAMVFYKH